VVVLAIGIVNHHLVHCKLRARLLVLPQLLLAAAALLHCVTTAASIIAAGAVLTPQKCL
jgi:hypothetical protein